jgi:tRNA pseudouridine55 synthase
VDVSEEQITAALTAFTGTVEQVPPMYSALKHHGTPLYRLARKGIEVEREPRAVEISRLELITWEPPDLVIELTCSPGTYVRALAHDIGQTLGCGAYLASLTRLASGRFTQADALSPADLARAVDEGRWEALLHPIDAALYSFPALHLSREGAKRICSGQTVAASEAVPGAEDETLGRAYGPDGRFLAVVAYDRAAACWRPRKVFCAERAQAYATPT